ncbi:CotY/CotZ family spore coat protein [Gracilibacillus alcaliphilus]|uniref:CotY/CotZ family spore coat protein n=1 Tax=Gracilibacillus alcaliphilus TaxID=1401441 RepID=UPI0019593CA5|nr:CotY/CotZ family spore coat protein [Gracilibacillus alcaliphilus]MBM7675494.1 spore coat protein Z [Gracilibacillus alcaliphilus]
MGVVTHNDCVCDVVRAIAEAQEDVDNQNCDISCHRSIKNLISGETSTNFDTVPFILFTKKGEPFKGIGAEIVTHGNARFDCVESFIFRVNKVKDCCATLELLVFEDHKKTGDTPCDQIDDESPEDLERTGICITVDLNCFCAISCLPAVSVL